MQGPRRRALASIIAATALALAACAPPDDEAQRGDELGAAAGPAAHLAKLQLLMGKLELRADQRATLESMAKDLALKLAPARQLRAEAVAEVARQVRAGKVDRPRLEALLKRAEALHQTLRPSLYAALRNVHRTLTQGQRKKLVAELQHGRRGGHHRHGLRALRRIAKQLALSDEQLDRIQDAVHGSMPAHGRLSQMLKLFDQIQAAKKAFVSDSFDPAQLEILKQLPALARKRIEHAITAAEKVLPILTAEQRARAAKLIVEHQSARSRL